MRVAAELDESSGGQRFDGDALGEHNPEPTGEIRRRERPQLGSTELDVSPQRRLHPRQRPQERRLADAIRPEQADELSRPREIDAFEHRAARPSAAIADGEIVGRRAGTAAVDAVIAVMLRTLPPAPQQYRHHHRRTNQ